MYQAHDTSATADPINFLASVLIHMERQAIGKPTKRTIAVRAACRIVEATYQALKSQRRTGRV